MHQAFSGGLELGHYMFTQILEDKSPCVAGFSLSDLDETPPD